jgi:hypothetical protein
MKASELQARSPQHVLVFGDPGSGKSTLVAELLNRGFNLFWVSTDGGHEVIFKLSAAAIDRADILVIPDTREYPVAFPIVKELLKLKPISICNAHAATNCVACKANGLSFTDWDLSKFGPKDILVLDHATGITMSAMSIITRGQKVDYKPQLDDYGALKFNIEALFMTIQHAPINIVVISQNIEAQSEDNKNKLFPAIGSKEFSRLAGNYFGHMVYCKIYQKKHVFGSASTWDISAITKSRSDLKIEEMKEPSLAPFFTQRDRSEALIAAESKLAGPGVTATLNSAAGQAAKVAADRLAKVRAEIEEKKQLDAIKEESSGVTPGVVSNASGTADISLQVADDSTAAKFDGAVVSNPQPQLLPASLTRPSGAVVAGSSVGSSAPVVSTGQSIKDRLAAMKRS